MQTVTRPTVPEVAPWVREYYRLPGNAVGGSLHIVLDDPNEEDSSVEFCRRWAIQQGDKEGERLAETLAVMTKTQRAKLRHIAGKYPWESNAASSADVARKPAMP